jgi:hypothetical protein
MGLRDFLSTKLGSSLVAAALVRDKSGRTGIGGFPSRCSSRTSYLVT